MTTAGVLLDVIDLHGEVTELGLDLPGVMDLVVRKVLDLVQAQGPPSSWPMGTAWSTGPWPAVPPGSWGCGSTGAQPVGPVHRHRQLAEVR
jgi:hypothetical protein